MDQLKSISFSAEAIQDLRRTFSKLGEVTPFSVAPKLAGKIASLGIFREVGTVNDELARFIFDSNTGEVVSRNSLKAEFVEWKGFTGIRIWSNQSSRLDIRARWFQDVIHPKFSYNKDKSISQLVIFPEIISHIAALQGVELVLVKSWGMNSIFGGFDPSKGYYQTNFWELENNDVLKFSNIVQNDQLAFLGTHDLIAHIVGVDRQNWEVLREQAKSAHEGISAYFQNVKAPTIAALILPYTIGVVLDDLAQPPTYGSASHAAILKGLLSELQTKSVPAFLPTILTQFPIQFEKIIEMARQPSSVERPDEIVQIVKSMVNEILRNTLKCAI